MNGLLFFRSLQKLPVKLKRLKTTASGLTNFFLGRPVPRPLGPKPLVFWSSEELSLEVPRCPWKNVETKTKQKWSEVKRNEAKWNKYEAWRNNFGSQGYQMLPASNRQAFKHLRIDSDAQKEWDSTTWTMTHRVRKGWRSEGHLKNFEDIQRKRARSPMTGSSTGPSALCVSLAMTVSG